VIVVDGERRFLAPVVVVETVGEVVETRYQVAK
jgi:hypothetical protein